VPDQPPKAVVAVGVEVETTPEAVEEAENIGKKILSGGLWRLLAYVFATIVAVLSTSVVSRAIGPVDFAAYTTAISLISVAQGLADFGLLALGIREFAALEGAARERNLRALITLRALFASIGAVAIVAFSVLADFSTSTVIGIAVASVGLVVISFYVSYCVPLQATYRFNEMAILDATRQGLWSGLMILAAITTGSVGFIVASLLPAAIVVAIATALVARKITSIKPSWDPVTMRTLLASVGAFAVAASIGASYSYLAQVASDMVLSGYDSGQFALAFRVFAVALGAGLIAIIGAFPLLVTSAKDDIERMVYATRRLMQTAVLTGFAAAVGLLTGASFVVAILGGPKYHDAIELLQIIGFALPVSFALNTGSTVLLAAGRHRELVAISVIGATISIAGTALLASIYGSTGAAIGIVVGETLLAAGYVTVLATIDRRALPRISWIGGVLIATLAGCAVDLIGLPSLVAAIVALGVFGVLIFTLRLLPPEVADRLPLRMPSPRGQ
jgi:O-antigen/teichoic acid export membrane protein